MDDEALMAELMEMMGGQGKKGKKAAKQEPKKGKAKKNEIPDDDELMAELAEMMAEDEENQSDDLKLSGDDNEIQDDEEIDDSAIGDDSEDEKPQPKKPEPQKPQNSPQNTQSASKPASKPQQPQQPAKPAAKPPPSYDFMNEVPEISEPQQKPQKPAQPAAKPQKPAEQKQPEPQKPQPAPKQPEIQKPTQPAPAPQPKKPEPQPEKPVQKPQPKPAPKPESKPESKPAPKPEPKPAPKPEPKPAPKPEPKPAPPKKKTISDIKSTSDYDKLYSTFASSFYTFLTASTQPEGKKFLDQVDELLPMVLDGPDKFNPNISVMSPKTIAPFYTKFSEFQSKDVISCSDPAKAAKIIPEMEKSLEEIRTDIKALVRIKEDQKKILPLLEATKKLERSIEIFPDYPYVIRDVLKYGFPVVNEDMKPKTMELSILNAENFPGEEFIIMSQIPLNDEANTIDDKNPAYYKFQTPVYRGKNPLMNYKNQWPLNQKSLILIQQHDAVMFFMNKSNKEIGHINVKFSGILNNCTVELECPVFDESNNKTNMKVYTKLRVRKAIRGNYNIIERSFYISPIAKFCKAAPKKPSDKPAAKPSAKSSNASKPNENEAAKSELRQATPAKPALPYFCLLNDDEMSEFWSIETLMFFDKSLTDLMQLYRNRKVEPPEQMIKMQKWAKEQSEKIMSDVQNEKISMEEYKEKLSQAIEREKVNVESCTAPNEKKSRIGYLSLMCKELSDFE